MIRYTTPTVPISIPADLTGAKIIVSFAQKGLRIDKEVDEIAIQSHTTIFSVKFSQQETAQFTSNQPVSVQANWIFESEERGATAITIIDAFANLLDEVITYGD